MSRGEELRGPFTAFYRNFDIIFERDVNWRNFY
jgi:hypothetical protein